MELRSGSGILALLDERFSWGGVELHFDVEKAISPAPRCLPTASTPRRWKPRRATARLPVPRGYAATRVRRLLVDFPDQEKELRELSTWIGGR